VTSLATATLPIRLSIVIASYNSVTTIGRCLRSLARQDDQAVFEVIVVDSSQDGTAALVARDFPRVKLFTFAERKFPGDARNIGVSKARGDIIAFTDADCFVDPAWATSVLEAHGERQQPVIGGAVENGNPESYVGWAYYFTEFSSWMPEATPCEMPDIPTTCLTMKRWVFERYGPFLEKTYCSDTAFNWTIARHGYRPLFLPSLRVWHINVTRLTEFLGRKVFHGSCFARVRVAEQRFSGSRRLAYIALSPLLPGLLFWRVLRTVRRKKSHITRFVLTSPLVLLGLLAWSWGELLGYLSTPARTRSAGETEVRPSTGISR